MDCWATHKFIFEKVADELQLPGYETSNYGMVMGNDTTLRGRDVCKGVTVTIQELTVHDDFLALELGGVDIILGMQWLKKMENMTVDWGAFMITFQAGDTQVTLKGDPTLTKVEISFKMLSRVWQVEDQGFLVELRALEKADLEQTESPLSNDVPPELSQVLSNFSIVFELPQCLPPQKAVDHRIVLNERQSPVNVRPYRYAHSQKNETERLIEEMLLSGVVRPSTSPFSSPVMLVKKEG